MAGSSDRKVIAYIGDTSDVKRKLRELETLNRRFGGKLGKDLSRGFQQVGDTLNKVSTTETTKGLNELSNTSTRTSKVLKDVDGSLVRVTESTKVNAKGVARTTTSFQDLNKNTVTLGQNISRLVKRAALTIPVWFALRGAISGTYRTISNGIGTLAKQDKAFQKARRNLEATASSQSELASQYQKLQEESVRLSLRTGKSVEELTNAFQKFATVGFDAETSLAGMIASTKLAVVEFGDATETANAFARAMRVLVDTSEGAKSESKQIAEAIALTDQLWQTNAFEIQEFTQNLLKFASVSKAANISTQETITLLATLSTGGLANRAGRLLRTTILKALQNLDEVAQSLNLNIDPAVDSTFDVILKLVGALEQLSKTQKVPKELADVLGELFTVRTTEVLASLRALRGTLQDNAKLVPDVNKLNTTFDNMTQTTGVLSDRFTNLNRELGKAFVIGLVGGDNFNNSLSDIVKLQKELIDDAKVLGDTFNALGKSLTSVGDIFRLTLGLVTLGTTEGIIKTVELTQEVDKSKKALSEFESVAQKFRGNLQIALSGGLDEAGLKRVIDGIETRLKNIKIEPELDRGALKKALDVLKVRYEQEKQITDEKKRQTEIDKENQIQLSKISKTNEVLLNQILQRMEASGALTSEILKTESALRSQLNLQDDYESKLSRQLEIERAINEEKQLQNNFSSTARKLFEVARDEGSDIAQRISEVLNQDIDFDTFIRRGGKAVDVFKDKFSDIFEGKQIEAFFKGNVVPELKGLRGGTNIELPVEDQALVKSSQEILIHAKSELSLATRRLAIEQQISALREADLKRVQQTISTNRLAGQGGFYTERVKKNPTDVGYIRSVPTTTPQSSTLSFQSGGINISINAKNAEDLNKQIDEKFETMKAKTKKEINNSYLGRQTPSS